MQSEPIYTQQIYLKPNIMKRLQSYRYIYIKFIAILSPHTNKPCSMETYSFISQLFENWNIFSL